MDSYYLRIVTTIIVVHCTIKYDHSSGMTIDLISILSFLCIKVIFIYKDIRTASRGLFLKLFNKLAERVLSGPKPLGLCLRCCSFSRLYIKVFFAIKTYFSAGNGIVTNRSKTKKNAGQASKGHACGVP